MNKIMLCIKNVTESIEEDPKYKITQGKCIKQ